MSTKYDYTEEMLEEMHAACANGINEDTIKDLMGKFDFPRRSVTAKMRKEGFTVPKKPGDAPTFTKEEGDALEAFLEANKGTYTAEEISNLDDFSKFSAKQITGKALSMDMISDFIKPAEKKVTVKTYSDEEEAVITAMVEENAYLEEIAEKVGRPVPSVRGKLLSMGLKAIQRDKKAPKSGSYEGLEVGSDLLKMTVAELVTHFSTDSVTKTERGVRTVLSRRRLECADYRPKALDKE
jgi:hypothetical protein